MNKNWISFIFIFIIILSFFSYFFYSQKTMNNLRYVIANNSLSIPYENIIGCTLYFRNMDNENSRNFWGQHQMQGDSFRITKDDLDASISTLDCENELLSKNYPISPNSKSEPVYKCWISVAGAGFAECHCQYAVKI